jgi:hypothetical protein
MSNDQRITEAESIQAWMIFSDRNKYLSLSDEQTVMVDAFVEAGQIKQETGMWPTVAEVHEKWGRERAERERKRLASWQPNYRFTEKDLAEYRALLAREECGPMVTFMGVVAHLKESAGAFPTVSEVRAHFEANQKAI